MSAACEIWTIDSEWGFHQDRVDQESAWQPVVLCATGLRSGTRRSFWKGDATFKAFFGDHADDLFVAHYAVAEMKYLLRLGTLLPERWFDTFVAWRFLTNQPGHLNAGLSGALCRIGVPHLAPLIKEDLRQKILRLEFNADDAADRLAITDYCYSDCDGCAALFERLQDRVPATHMGHWMEYLKAVSRMELRGIPIDIDSYERVKSMQPAIKRALIADINAVYPIFDGESFSRGRFLAWCKRAGIQWPTKRSDVTSRVYHPVDKETLKSMEHHHPFIPRVRETLKTLNSFRQHELVVDKVRGRHYYSTSVFRTVTGRNQPRAFIFAGPKWSRYLIKPESPDHLLVYVDYIAQEIGIAAALSNDPVMQAVYIEADCHLAFAIRAGAAPVGATRVTHSLVRKRYKTVNLGVLYGQTEYGIASRLGIVQAEAERLLGDHRNLFRVFWAWSERMVQGAYDRGWIVTPCGWRSKVPFNSGERTWMNWPMQAAGADIMRLTITYLDRQNVHVLAPVHDGVLLSCRRDQLVDLQAAVDWACTTAVGHVLPGFPLRWDVAVHEGRFEDEDGAPLWTKLQEIMEAADAAQAR